MRWFSFTILAYIAIGLQLGLSHALEWHGAGPDLVLLAVIFVCMNAPRDAALLAALILGMLHDLTTQGTMGLYCFAYGVTALFLVSSRSAVDRKHPLTHVVLGLVRGLIVAVILIAHNVLHPPSNLHLPAATYFYSAIDSAIAAPIVLGILQRMSGLFGFEDRHRRRAAVG